MSLYRPLLLHFSYFESKSGDWSPWLLLQSCPEMFPMFFSLPSRPGFVCNRQLNQKVVLYPVSTRLAVAH